jgi:PEP-CTERM motif
MRKFSWIFLALLLGAAAGTARADQITFTLSASLNPVGGGAGCSPSPCILSGTLTIDNTSGDILAADLQFSNTIFASQGGPYTDIASLPAVYFLNSNNIGSLCCFNSAVGYFTGLFLTAANNSHPPANLIGYVGGLVYGAFVQSPSGILWESTDWGGNTVVGALTLPEPATFSLMLLGIGLALVMRKRIAEDRTF